jgi:cell division protein FtsQ
VNKQIKQNRYKPEPSPPTGKTTPMTSSKKPVQQILLVLGLVFLMSISAIWIHDAITQSPYFAIKQVDISGTHRVEIEDVRKLTGVTDQTNLFQINLNTIENKIISHPWIAKASVKRSFFSGLVVTIVEHEPLAIVNIENLADIIINTQGHPFKEYDPQKDKLNFLPVISGVDLTHAENAYQFEGPLFNAIMDLLKIQGFGKIDKIHSDDNIGITILTQDIYNKNPTHIQKVIPVKLGFARFEEKRIKAIKISEYMDTYFPEKTISAMDLYEIEKIFITTKETNTLHHNIEKGA